MTTPEVQASAGPVGGATAAAERRRQPRYKCEGSAEFSVEGSDIRTWGTLTDISMCGCYVELQATFPVDTQLNLLLEVNEVRVQLSGVVRVSYPFLGMGISFADVSEETKTNLSAVVRTLNGGAIGMGADVVKVVLPQVADCAKAYHAIAAAFVRKTLMTRDEFIEVVRNSQPGTR